MRVEVHESLDSLVALRPQWQALEARALEPNAYLSARFVLPALKHLPRVAPVWAVSVHDRGAGGGTLRGLGLFQPRPWRPLFPVPHARVYASPHSYLGGLLLDAEAARPALQSMLDALARRVGGLRVDKLNATGATARLLRAVVAERGGSWHEEEWLERACIVPGAGGAARWRQHIPAARLRTYERQWRKLAQQGDTSWHYLRGEEVRDGTINRFVELEHAGWKGAQGTSLRSDPRHARFFGEMTRAFRADGDIFFTELRLAGEVIASTCNLRAGGDGFAFKVCFDPRHARHSPGVLNELGFVKALEQAVDDFRLIDSGAEPGSFIEQLWPDRLPLYSGTISLGRWARVAAHAAQGLSRLRRRWVAGPGQPRPVSDSTPERESRALSPAELPGRGA